MPTEEIKQEDLNSVKFSINAKGFYSAEIKVYANTIEEALKKACGIAQQIEGVIKVKNGL